MAEAKKKLVWRSIIKPCEEGVIGKAQNKTGGGG